MTNIEHDGLMARWWRRLLESLRLFNSGQRNAEILSESTRERWLDLIEQRGYSAYFWLPGIEHHDDQDLWEALEGLKRAGYIITRPDGTVAGKLAKTRLSRDEKASQRRATFRVVE